jgi:4-amino-4-deoxy-L-arabinose transferase-like glycosyltransferase
MDPTGDIVALSALCAFAVGTLYIGRKQPVIANCLIVGFGLRLAAALIQFYVVPLPGSEADAMEFAEKAYAWGTNDFVPLRDYFSTGAPLYSWIGAALYRVAGPSALLLQSINVMLGTLMILNVYLGAQRLWGSRVAVTAAWLTAFHPTLVLYSALTMREMAVSYPVTLGVYCLIRWFHGRRIAWFAGALASFAAGLAFHTAVAFIVLGSFVLLSFDVYRSARTSDPEALLRSGLLMAGAATVCALVIATGFGLQKLGSLEELTVETIAEQQGYATRSGGATYLEGLRPNTWLDLLWQVPLRAIYFLFTPFPWMVRGLPDLLALMDGLLWLMLVGNIIRTSSVWSRIRAARGLVMISSLFIAAFAIGVSNYGTALRHRAKVLPIVVVLIPAWSRQRVVRRALRRDQRELAL